MIPVYFNFFSIGWLIAVSFYTVASVFCFSIRNRSRAAFHLGMTFVLAVISSLAYAVSASVYHPVMVVHRYFTIFFILGTLIHTMQFFLCFPDDDYRKARRTILAILWTGALGITGYFIYESLTASSQFLYFGHYWDFRLDELSRNIGYLILGYALLGIFTGFWRFFVTKGKVRWAVITCAFSVALVGIVPAIANILSRDGAMGRETYLLLLVFLTVIGYFMVLIIFINNTRDRTSFMTKIIGTCLVFFMVILLGTSYYASNVNERSYDIIQQNEMKILQARDERRPAGSKFIARFKMEDGTMEIMQGEGPALPDFTDHEYAYINAVYYDKIRRLELSNYAAEIASILNDTHDYFAGYKQDLVYFMSTMEAGDQDPVGTMMHHIDETNRLVFFYNNRIRGLPAATFRKDLVKFLAGTKDSFGLFRRLIENKIGGNKAEGENLRAEVLRYLAPFQAPESRHYHTGIDGTSHYICYLLYDEKAAMVYDTGFSYGEYRKYIHPDSRIMVLLLLVVVLVISVVFRFFFLGTLIHPLADVLRGLREVQKGNLEISIPIKVEDEIGFMSQNFNEMVWAMAADRKKLDDYANHLGEMVEQRTQELQRANNELAAAMAVMEGMNDELVDANKELKEAERIAAMDMAMAQNVQSSFFPKEVPHSREWEISFVFKPMSGISGDMYDYYEEDGRLKGLSLFDVSGHGIASGLVTMIAKSIVYRKFNGMSGSKLHEIIESVNEELIHELGKVDNYLTGIILRFVGDRVELVNAGHTDPLFISGKDGKVKVVDIKDQSIKGMFLGIEIMKGVFTSIGFPMGGSDMLLLYTDCLLESKNGDNEEFGIKRVVHALKEARGESTAGILRKLVNELYLHTGTENLTDDLTIILIKRL